MEPYEEDADQEVPEDLVTVPKKEETVPEQQGILGGSGVVFIVVLLIPLQNVLVHGVLHQLVSPSIHSLLFLPPLS